MRFSRMKKTLQQQVQAIIRNNNISKTRFSTSCFSSLPSFSAFQPPIVVTNKSSSIFLIKGNKSGAFSTSASSSSKASFEEEKQEKTSFSDPEQIILQNALSHVTELGWTVESLAAGAKDAGYPSVAHGMFTRGPIELVEYFMENCNVQLKQKLTESTAELQAMSVADRLKFGIRTRLQLLMPVFSTWPQAMALGALPQNAPTTMKSLANMADDIWYFAGDQSTDASWYTKRAILTGIYASTGTVWYRWLF
jgi:ubiquinone biosynthesis protein COQ9